MTTTQQGPARVLVVEDDRSLADLYAEWLSGTYDVETTYDGTEALDRLDDSIDVVLLDRMMPGLSGGDVLEAVRDADVSPQVVMVSAVTPDLDVVQMGFDSYIEKPTDSDTLHETVDRMLTRAEYDEKLQELFSLIERQDTLEAVKRPETLASSQEYRALTERLESVQAEVESLLTHLPDRDFRVAVERLQRTAAERTGERQYESLTEDVLDSSKEATVVVDSDGTVVWANAATETLLGLDRTDIRGREYAAVAASQFGDIEAGSESLASLIQRGLESHSRELDATVRVPAGAERPTRWLEYWSAPVESGLYAGGRIEHYHDITGRYRREQYLQALHEATRDLMAAESREAVVDRTVSTATGALDFQYAAVFTRDETSGDLVPAGQDAAAIEPEPDLPTLSGGSGPVWAAFADESDLLDAATYRAEHGSSGWLDDAFTDWLVCSLGMQGVFVVATTAETALSPTKRSLARTWAANARQALEQIARTHRLRERDRELQRQNEQLSRLDRINRIIRSISPAVVSADSRAAVEREVCRRLLGIDAITGAWVADLDMATGQLVRRATAGELDGYLSGVPGPGPESAGSGLARATPAVPARRALETEAPVSVRDLMGIAPGPWWRDRGLQRGTHTITAIPVTHESTRFGAIEIHIDRPQGMSDGEVEAFEQLGVTIGHAIGAIQQRDALLAGGAVALEFSIAPTSALSRFATAVEGPLATIDVSSQDDGSYAVFVTVDIDTPEQRDRVTELVQQQPDVSLLREDESSATCTISLGRDAAIRNLVEQGAALREVSLQTGSEQMAVTVELPYATDVREYVDAVTGELPDAELVAKYDLTAPERAGTAAAVDGTLTDKQRQALRVAFHSGYFDWPRVANAETVASNIGIAQSTFSQHLRSAERKLLEELFT
jgi:PAS domain S-box-containing protein